MDIVFLNAGGADKSGNIVTALYLKPLLGPIVNGTAAVTGYQRASLSFPTVDALLSWASKHHNGGAPCAVSGDRVVSASAPAEKAPKGK